MACFSPVFPFLVNSTIFHQMLRARNMSHPWVLFPSFWRQNPPPNPITSIFEIHQETDHFSIPTPGFFHPSQRHHPLLQQPADSVPGVHPCCVPSHTWTLPNHAATRGSFKNQAPPLRNPTTLHPTRGKILSVTCQSAAARGLSDLSSSPTMSPPGRHAPSTLATLLSLGLAEFTSASEPSQLLFPLLGMLLPHLLRVPTILYKKQLGIRMLIVSFSS